MVQLTQSLEDYLEAIFIISQTKKVVRVKNLMDYFGYKVSSVNHAIKLLSEMDLIEHEKYGYIELTDKGRDTAGKLYEKHKSLSRFFINILDIDEKTATEDACAVEHHLHKKTYKSWYQLLQYMEKTGNGKVFVKNFKKFLKKT